MEIERKYLVNRIPENLDAYEAEIMRQGYLCRMPTLRVRQIIHVIAGKVTGENYIFTFKSPVKLNTTARVNREVESELPKESFESLIKKCDGTIIEKTRYVIPLEDGHVAELDIFEGKHEGLVIVEVEFKDEEDSLNFKAPDWFGEDVSSDYHYTNSYLSSV